MADKEMSFLEHLEDLRWHLLRSITAILIAALAAFLAKDFVFDVLLFGPKKLVTSFSAPEKLVLFRCLFVFVADVCRNYIF